MLGHSRDHYGSGEQNFLRTITIIVATRRYRITNSDNKLILAKSHVTLYFLRPGKMFAYRFRLFATS